MISLFVKTERQKTWIAKLYELEIKFKNTSIQTDEEAIFPTENIQDLIKIGYTSSTLPTAYGGEGLTVYDMVLLQETLASFDGNTALSIGWNLGVVGELYEKRLWNDKNLDFFAKEVLNGALVNRSVSEAQTGSPTEGAAQEQQQ